MSTDIGTNAPTFTLPDTEGAEHTVPAAESPGATVLIVTCNHCKRSMLTPV